MGISTRALHEQLDRLRADRVPFVHARVVLAEDDVRPKDYAVAFAREANLVLLAEDESPRPPWWMALRAEGRVRALQADRPELLRQLGESTRPGARQT